MNPKRTNFKPIFVASFSNNPIPRLVCKQLKVKQKSSDLYALT